METQSETAYSFFLETPNLLFATSGKNLEEKSRMV